MPPAPPLPGNDAAALFEARRMGLVDHARRPPVVASGRGSRHDRLLRATDRRLLWKHRRLWMCGSTEAAFPGCDRLKVIRDGMGARPHGTRGTRERPCA